MRESQRGGKSREITRCKKRFYLSLSTLGVLDRKTSGRFREMTLGPLTVTFSSAWVSCLSRNDNPLSGLALVFFGEKAKGKNCC